MQIHDYPSETIKADLCVVGGGMAGLCTAIAAARHGAKVVLIQDRPVLGGNASSEVRMWICGAHGRDAKETGILEEILLENCYRNSELSYTVWDTVLYEKARYQDGVHLLLNTAVCKVHAEGEGAERRITAVEAWHLTRQAWLRVEATFFADCSGDSVLRTCGAEFRWGREARHEFDEPAAPEVADRKTMGNSLLLQVREIDAADHTPFVPPAWAHVFPADHHRVQHAKPNGDNFWWIEIGGEIDTQADADKIRDELYRIAFGVWAFIKNHPDGRGKRWELEWIGSLPGKRENVRYVGDHTLRQKEIEACGKFPDVVCHGGWTMDDHPPAAFNNVGVPTTFHPAPSPYGIPYRSLYSANIANLFFAGRNISCTHMAMSSTRVMATCATMGQAVGTAAALALKHRTSPRGVYQNHLNELQTTLLDDDQFLPGRARPIPVIARAAGVTSSAGSAEVLRDGIDRRLGDDDHWLQLAPGGWIEYRFAQPTAVQRLRLVGDTQLHRDKRLPCRYPAKHLREEVPVTLARDLRIEGQAADGTWSVLAEISDNRRRVLKVDIAGSWQAVKVTVIRTWGAATAGIFACDVGAAVTAGEIPTAPWLAKPIAKGAHA
jgi:hypothetical protein